MALNPPRAAEREGHQYDKSTVKDHAVAIFGDVTNYGSLFPAQPDVPLQFGLCLGPAPEMDPTNFIGRATEIAAISEILQPDVSWRQQRRVLLGGMGGVGKTQLAIAYAQHHRRDYDSVFWLNATSELTLKASFRLITGKLVPAEELEVLNDQQVLARAHKWLSNPSNVRWLLIFDNHDDPDIFDITQYCPYAGHGSILITTRMPDRIRLSSRQIHVQCLQNIEDGLDILQTRSHRADVRYDADARRLAERLAGYPLALATAGAYLSKSASVSFGQYLQAYEQRWYVDPRRPLPLQEYQDRTLFTTWNLSFSRLERDDPLAAKLLRLLAYFDHQVIWYGLLSAGLREDSPDWLVEIFEEEGNFDSVMRTLIEYCLVEVQIATQLYSIHSCVHDWMLAELNKTIEPQLYWYPFDCIATIVNAEEELKFLKALRYSQVAKHALRLTHHRFQQSDLLDLASPDTLSAMYSTCVLLAEQIQYSAAEQLFTKVLVRQEIAIGSHDPSTLATINSFALLYMDQEKYDKAEQLLLRALAGREKVLGPYHSATMHTVNNLGLLYYHQKKLDKAEQMYLRALDGKERTLGPEHFSTLTTVDNLGTLYDTQGKLDDAERMYVRALAGKEKVLGPEHFSTLTTVNNLGLLYNNKGKLDKAEQMYLRAVVGTERVLGPTHTSTLTTIYNLGILYYDLGRWDDSEKYYQRALDTYEITLGPEHAKVMSIKRRLAYIRDIKNGDASYSAPPRQARLENAPSNVGPATQARPGGTSYDAAPSRQARPGGSSYDVAPSRQTPPERQHRRKWWKIGR